MNIALNGFGLGLRSAHYPDFVAAPQRVDWLEIPSGNYLQKGAKDLRLLEHFRQDYPLVMHGDTLALGSPDPLNANCLEQIRELVRRLQPAWISDHLDGAFPKGLTLQGPQPLPYTRQSLRRLCARIGRIQDFLGRSLVVENPSSYARCAQDEMSEWGFLREMASISGCELLLDIKNIYLNSINHDFDARVFIDAMPAGSVRQIHLAGLEEPASFAMDTHAHAFADPVWHLYAYTLKRCGFVDTLVERDDPMPPLPELVGELDRARHIAQCVAQASAGALSAS